MEPLYYGAFLQTKVGVSAVVVSMIMLIGAWRPIGGILGGYLADKINKKWVLSSTIFLSSILLLLMSFLPLNSSQTLFYVVVVLSCLFTWAIRGIYWSLLEECRIDDK